MKILRRKIINSISYVLLAEQVHNWITKKPSEAVKYPLLAYFIKKNEVYYLNEVYMQLRTLEVIFNFGNFKYYLNKVYMQLLSSNRVRT